MYDRWQYKIPANTAEEDAIRVKCPVSPGFLKSLTIYNPPGCQSRARSRIFLGEKPIAPRSASNYIALEGIALTISDMNEPIKDDLPVLNWDVWNVDTMYPHTIWMSAEWISVDEPYEKTTTRLMREFIDVMKRMVGL